MPATSNQRRANQAIHDESRLFFSAHGLTADIISFSILRSVELGSLLGKGSSHGQGVGDRIIVVASHSSEKGFFFDLPFKNPSIPCNFVMVECKNYVGEVANPELDQLAGRFSPRRGRFGILACRSLDENDGFLKRCADTFADDRGLIIPITDADIIAALAQYPEKGPNAIEEILQSRYRVIAFSK